VGNGNVCVCVNEAVEGMLDGRYGWYLRARVKSLEEVGKHSEKKRQWRPCNVGRGAEAVMYIYIHIQYDGGGVAVTPPPSRGGFCVPSTAAAAIDYLKRSAACPGKLRHLHAALPGPTSAVLSPRPRRCQRGPTAKQCDTADTAARTHTPTPTDRADRPGGNKNRTPSPPARTSRRPPLSRNIFCPQDLNRCHAVAFPLPLTAT